jgi:hypothetical protein
VVNPRHSCRSNGSIAAAEALRGPNCRPIIKTSPGRRRPYVTNRALRILPVYSLVLLVTGWRRWSCW